MSRVSCFWIRVALLIATLVRIEARRLREQIVLDNRPDVVAFKPTKKLALFFLQLNPIAFRGRRNVVRLNNLNKNAQASRLRLPLSMGRPLDDLGEQPGKTPVVKVWPCGDKLDKQICSLGFFAFLNLLVLPLTGAIDLIFIGKLGNPLAVAGQAVADRIYNTAALLNVVDRVTNPRVAKANAAGDSDAVQREVGGGIFLSLMVGTLLSLLVGLGSNYWLLALGSTAALPFSLPYLFFRLPGTIPATLATVAFGALQAVKDTVTPLKISILSCIVNAALNYILMFKANLGISGAALATTASQIVASIAYVVVLSRRKLLKWNLALRPPSRRMLSELGAGIGAMQMRNAAGNIALLAITKLTQNMDKTGVAASAHAVVSSLWQIGCVALVAFSMVGQILTSAELGKKDASPEAVRSIARRVLAWGALVGSMVGMLQVAGLPLLGVFTSVPEVRQAARAPSVIGAALQPLYGIVFAGEGLMTAAGAFGIQAKGMVVATALFLLALKKVPSTLSGVWLSLGVWMLARLANVIYFFWFTESPFKLEREGDPPLESAHNATYAT